MEMPSIEVDGSGYSERLKDTDRSRSALQDGGKHDTDQYADNGVGEHGEYLDEGRAFLQRVNRAAHIAHADHKHGKAEHDISDIVVLFLEHSDENAHKRDDTGKCGGGKKGNPSVAAA